MPFWRFAGMAGCKWDVARQTGGQTPRGSVQHLAENSFIATYLGCVAGHPKSTFLK